MTSTETLEDVLAQHHGHWQWCADDGSSRLYLVCTCGTRWREREGKGDAHAAHVAEVIREHWHVVEKVAVCSEGLRIEAGNVLDLDRGCGFSPSEIRDYAAALLFAADVAEAQS